MSMINLGTIQLFSKGTKKLLDVSILKEMNLLNEEGFCSASLGNLLIRMGVSDTNVVTYTELIQIHNTLVS